MPRKKTITKSKEPKEITASEKAQEYREKMRKAVREEDVFAFKSLVEYYETIAKKEK